MSFKTPQFYNKTSADVEIILNCPVLLANRPIVLTNGNDTTQIMDIVSDDVTMAEMTATGDYASAITPALVNGSIFYTANSPVIGQLSQLVNLYFTVGLYPSVISVKSKSGQWNYTLDNVIIKKPFAGYKLGKVIDVTVFDFTCTAPKNFTFADIANIAGGIIDII